MIETLILLVVVLFIICLKLSRAIDRQKNIIKELKKDRLITKKEFYK